MSQPSVGKRGGWDGAGDMLWGRDPLAARGSVYGIRPGGPEGSPAVVGPTGVIVCNEGDSKSKRTLYMERGRERERERERERW